MKTIIRIIILAFFIYGTSSCSSGRKLTESSLSVNKLTDKAVITDGSVVYALPRTVFTIFTEVERKIEMPGPYATFANDLLGLDGVIQSKKESWTIKNIEVMIHTETDPSEYYVIKCNNTFQSNVLALKNEGLILDADYSNYIPFGTTSITNKYNEENIKQYDLGADEYFQVQRDTAYKRANIDSTFIRIPYLVEKKKKLTTEQMAEKAAKRLLEMRDGKHLILTGEANVFPQSEAVINEMNRMEKEYTELFTGESWCETYNFSYEIIPTKEMASKPLTLFNFSELKGVVDSKEKGSVPVTLEIIPEQKTKDIMIVQDVKTNSSAPVFDKLYYRIPDIATLKIKYNGSKLLYNSRQTIYQLGQIIQLPSNYIIGH
jgi:hypothetical protein